MDEIRPGILSLDGESYPEGGALIVVHPWYLGYSGYYELYEFNGSHRTASFDGVFEDGEYCKNLLGLIRRHDGPIVIFEEARKVEKSEKFFCAKIDKREGIYFVPTVDRKPNPVSIGWDDVSSWIEDFSSDAIFAGGYLRGSSGSYKACLGGAYNELKNKLDSRFVEGCCFADIV